MNEPLGQILPGSKFGDMLTELARNSKTIIEIGTWHGLGSTKCLSFGLWEPDQRMWTIESDPEIWKEAKSYYDDERIKFLNGTGLSMLHRFVPMGIDLMLFDGSDLETDAEFDAYSPYCKIVCLDDTRERKNRRQRETILNDPKAWIVLADEINTRNGWLVARRNDA